VVRTIDYIMKISIDCDWRISYTHITLLIEGRFLETILKAEQVWRLAATGS